MQCLIFTAGAGSRLTRNVDLKPLFALAGLPLLERRWLPPTAPGRPISVSSRAMAPPRWRPSSRISRSDGAFRCNLCATRCSGARPWCPGNGR